MIKIAKALHTVQKEAPALQKDSINPHFGSSFISLNALMEQVLPLLNKHGLVLVQAPMSIDGAPGLRTEIIHAESGESVGGTMPLVLGKSDPQGQGSAITYARRYALMSILGLVADEDDDGNAATPAPRKSAGKKQREPAGADPFGGESGSPI